MTFSNNSLRQNAVRVLSIPSKWQKIKYKIRNAARNATNVP